MKAPLTWLKDYVEIDCTPEELAEKLFSCGFEVEELIYRGKDIDRVVSCRIESIIAHPDADKLVITQIDAGNYGKLQIVTAAKNMKVGDIVPVALDGSTLPSCKIKTGKLRGVTSEGMFCSGAEFGITDVDYMGASVDGLLILHPDTPLGMDMKEVLGLDEYIFDIGVTANRPDCQSIVGLAREIAAVLNKPLTMPCLTYGATSEPIQNIVEVKVEASDLCPRYMAGAVRDITLMPSPSYVQKRLKLCGIRSINNIVDITNFVLLELGQPMHAFDLNTLEGGSINVRRAFEGEKITTLDEKESTLNHNMLVICDSQKPVALAGIMGGLNSGISSSTKTVVFECAKFKRDSVRKTSKVVGVRSDSSARYEKGVDAASPEIALARALHLVEEFGAGKIARSIIDICVENPVVRTVQVKLSEIDGLLGIQVPHDIMVDILNRLQIHTELDAETLICSVPPYREDIEAGADIAEEIIRMYGYDHLHPILMEKGLVINGGRNVRQTRIERVRNMLKYEGCREVVTYAFTSKKNIAKINLAKEEKYSAVVQLVNPLSEDIEVMRTSLLPSILDTVALNLNRKNENFRLFEMARVFLPKALPLTELPEEREHLSIILQGEDESFYTMKGVIESLLGDLGLNLKVRVGGESYLHPNRAAVALAGKVELGSFGELHPDVLENFGIKKKVYYAELDMDQLLTVAFPATPYINIPKYPSIARDIALNVPREIGCQDVVNEIKKAGGNQLTAVKLFDLYEGDKIASTHKSMAFSLEFQASDRTLKVEEADESIANILKALEKKFGIKLRQ